MLADPFGEIVLFLYFYHPQTKLRKVMFLHVFVGPRGVGVGGCG